MNAAQRKVIDEQIAKRMFRLDAKGRAAVMHTGDVYDTCEAVLAVKEEPQPAKEEVSCVCDHADMGCEKTMQCEHSWIHTETATGKDRTCSQTSYCRYKAFAVRCLLVDENGKIIAGGRA